MNLALPAVFLLVLLLPGLILISGFQGKIIGRFISSRVVDLRPMSVDWLLSFVASPILLYLWVELAESVTSFQVDARASFALLSGEGDEAAIAAIADSWEAVSLFFVSLYIVSAAAGVGLHELVRWKRLDVKFPFLRFNNEWHYLLSGELHGSDPKPDGALVTAAIDSEGKTYLYSGILDSFSYGPDGDLSKVTLRGAVRRAIATDRKDGEQQKPLGTDDRYYAIEGHRLVLWCGDVKTLNIRYYRETERGAELLDT